MEYAIETNNLSIGYGPKTLYTKLDFRLQKDELTCLLGKNGTGKSTLLRTLCHLQPKLGGEVLLEGKPLEAYSRNELSRKVSIVLTERVSAENMTVSDVLELGRSPYTGFFGTLSESDKQKVAQSAQLTGVEDLLDRRLQTLSDGERQKVMIAKAVAQETPIILLDEPSAFLDYPSKIKLMQLLRKLAHELGKTILLSTHDLEHALQMADNIWLLDKEKGMAQGTVDHICKTGTLENFFDIDDMVFDRQKYRYETVKQ